MSPANITRVGSSHVYDVIAAPKPSNDQPHEMRGGLFAVRPLVVAAFASLRPSTALRSMTSTAIEDPLKPVVFCGPSGVGKGTLIDLLIKRFPNDQFGFSVSHTTRAPRPGEEDGVHYNFTTVEQIKKDIEAGKFIEYAEVHGKYYGTRYETRSMNVILSKDC